MSEHFRRFVKPLYLPESEALRRSLKAFGRAEEAQRLPTEQAYWLGFLYRDDVLLIVSGHLFRCSELVASDLVNRIRIRSKHGPP